MLLTAAAPPSGMPLYVNPEKAEPGAEFTGEGAARDYDSLGTNTWSTRALSRNCTRAGGCAGVPSSSTVWSGFPGGYRPRAITVHWKAAASGGLFGAMTQVRAFVEFSQDGEHWSVLGRFVTNEPFAAIPDSVSTSVVPAGTDPAALSVRARLEVEIVSCPNVPCPTDLPNPSNVSGQMWVSDIRLEVGEPALVAEPARPRRGQPVEIRLHGAPGAQIGNWTFTTTTGVKTLRTENLTSDTWRFPILESGTVSATVRLRGQRQLEGRTFDVTAPVEVQRSP